MSTADEWAALMRRKEKLHKDLRAYVEQPDGLGFKMLRHPLIVTMYHEQMNAMYNEQYKAKKKYLAELHRKRKWAEAVWFYERPYRFAMFMNKYYRRMPAKKAGDLLLDLWVDSEWPSHNADTWYFMFRVYRNISPAMIKSREILGDEPVRVYRGMSEEEAENAKFGLSWTTNQKIAMWFARRFKMNGITVAKTIHPRHVFAFVESRGESEIVLDPKELQP